MELLIAFFIGTLLNLAALYLEWRDKSLKYQRIGQAMVAIEQRIVELERSRTNDHDEARFLGDRVTNLEDGRALERTNADRIQERVASIERIMRSQQQP